MSKKHKWKWPVLITGGVVAMGAIGFWLWLPANGLPPAQRFIRWQFEDVRHVTPAGLAEWLADASRTAPVLLDIRREVEFSESHLPNARRVAPDATDEEIKKTLQHLFLEKKKVKELQDKLQTIGKERNTLKAQLEHLEDRETPRVLEQQLQELQDHVTISTRETEYLRVSLVEEQQKTQDY